MREDTKSAKQTFGLVVSSQVVSTQSSSAQYDILKP